MKSEKLLYRYTAIKVGLLCIVPWFGVIYAMNFEEKNRPIDRKLALQGFLLTPLYRVSSLTNVWVEEEWENADNPQTKEKRPRNITNEVRNEIRNRLIDDNDTNKNLIRLLNFATLIPDIQRKATGNVFGKNDEDLAKEDNDLDVIKCLIKPVRQVPQYIFYQQVIDNKIFSRFTEVAFDGNKPDKSEMDMMLALLDEIKIVDQLVDQNIHYVCNSEEVKALLPVANEFFRIYKKKIVIHIAYREAYTVSNFVANTSGEQINNLMLFAMPLMSVLIEKACGIKALNQNMLDADESIDRITWRDLKLKDPFPYCEEDRDTVLTPYAMIPILYGGIKAIVLSADSQSAGALWRVGRWLGNYAFAIVVSSLLMVFTHSILPCASPVFENRLIASCTVLASYVLACALYNIKKMRSLKKSAVDLKTLSELLKNGDIEIE